jgi:hypothetical protein
MPDRSQPRRPDSARAIRHSSPRYVSSERYVVSVASRYALVMSGTSTDLNLAVNDVLTLEMLSCVTFVDATVGPTARGSLRPTLR